MFSAFTLSVMMKLATAYLLLASFVCLLWAAELRWPRGPLISNAYRLRIISFTAIYTLFAIPIAVAFGHIHHSALIHGWVAWPVAILAGDFLYYWYHRAQHTFPLLWRYHSVHHSAEELGAGASYNHWLEAPLRALFCSAPLLFLVAQPEALILSYVLAIHGFYVHSATALNFGPLARIFPDNRTHRIHHSVEPRQFNRNFGRYTMLWDWLFGSAYYHPTEWPAVGLSDQREPQTIMEYLKLPDSRRSARPKCPDPQVSSSEFA